MLATEEVIYPDCHAGTGIDMANQSIIDDYLGMESEANFDVDGHVDSPSSPPKKLCKCGCGNKAMKDRQFTKGHGQIWFKKHEGLLVYLYWSKELSLKEIEKLVGVQMQTLWYLMEKNNHPIRTCSEARMGDKNPFYGKHHTAEQKDKWSKDRTGTGTGKDNSFFNNHHTEETRKIMRGNHADYRGDKNPQWKGGIAHLPYPFEFNEELRGKIRKRDGHRCVGCDKLEGFEGRLLAVHHIDYDKNNCTEDNLISLCNSCHSKTESKRKYWIKYYQDLLERRYS